MLGFFVGFAAGKRSNQVYALFRAGSRTTERLPELGEPARSYRGNDGVDDSRVTRRVRILRSVGKKRSPPRRCQTIRTMDDIMDRSGEFGQERFPSREELARQNKQLREELNYQREENALLAGLLAQRFDEMAKEDGEIRPSFPISDEGTAGLRRSRFSRPGRR